MPDRPPTPATHLPAMNSLTRTLLRAFKSVTRPAPTEWVTGLSWQDDDILQALLAGRRINDSFIEEFRDCLTNFSVGAKMYAIPRYLSYVIRYPDRDATDYLMAELKRLVQDREFMQRLTRDQIGAIMLGLRFLAPHIEKFGTRNGYADTEFALRALQKMHQ